MWLLGIVYIVKFSIQDGIVISYDHLVFTPILSQMIESFTEVGGRFKLDCKAVGGNSFMIDYLKWACFPQEYHDSPGLTRY